MFQFYLGDKNKPKAWSKYAPESTAYKKLQDDEKESNFIGKSVELDPVTKYLNDKVLNVLNLFIQIVTIINGLYMYLAT